MQVNTANFEQTPQNEKPFINTWSEFVQFHRKRIQVLTKIMQGESAIKKNSKRFKMMRATYYIQIEEFVKWMETSKIQRLMRGVQDIYDRELEYFTNYLNKHKSEVNENHRHLFRIFNSKNGNFQKFKEKLIKENLWDLDREKEQHDTWTAEHSDRKSKILNNTRSGA